MHPQKEHANMLPPASLIVADASQENSINQRKNGMNQRNSVKTATKTVFH